MNSLPKHFDTKSSNYDFCNNFKNISTQLIRSNFYEKAILFDLDGTLWHTSDVILPIWNEVLKNHPETTKQITLDEMNSYMGKTIEQIASIMLPELSEENGVSIIKECCAVEVPYLEKSGGHLYENLEEVLRALSESIFSA